MFKVTKYPTGTFSWADSMSTDAVGGKQFYQELMGWEVNDTPMGDGTFYTMFQVDGEDVAGLGQMSSEMIEQGMPSVWNSYVSVDDVDAMVDKITELGGTVVAGPFDVFDSGRMLTLQDPTGAFLSLWQPKSHIGAGLVNTPGAMSWNDLNTRDPQPAIDFYSALFGWEFTKVEGMEYYNISNNGRMNGGIFVLPDEMSEVPSHWMAYFSVEDVDAKADQVGALGGTVHVPPRDIPGVGRFSVIADPQGAVSTLIQVEQPQPWDL